MTATRPSDLRALAALAESEGAIDAEESRVVDNILRFEQVPVEDVMTPRTVTIARPTTMSLGEFVNDEEASHHSRIPIYEGKRDQVVGYVLQREALGAAARGTELSTPLGKFKRQVEMWPEDLPLPKALRAFLERRQHLAMVIDEHGGMSGLVTLEDVIETILGVEIMDESDKVADLRVHAKRLRTERLARSNNERPETSGANPDVETR